MWNPFKKKQRIIYIEQSTPVIKISSNSLDFYDDVETVNVIWALLNNFPNIIFQEKIELLNLFLKDKYKFEEK